MGSPYRPTVASSMTGSPVKRQGMLASSVAQTLIGGEELPNAVAGMNDKFQTPAEGKPMFNASKSTFPPPTHSYSGGMQNSHTVHSPRI
jgi:hypothetical protein